MPREILQVDGVSKEAKKKLRDLALHKFGQSNASLIVRSLISDYINSDKKTESSVDLSDDKIAVEIRLPRGVVEELEKLAENRLSKRNYYICSLIYEHLKKPQLQGDEIEVLRRSNYQLAKIGTNLNQIAKAFNLIVAAGGGERVPEIGKKMASLRTEIKSHTNKVLRILESKTAVWEKAPPTKKTKK